MFCPRLNHNVRLSQKGTLQVCGHMSVQPTENFSSLDDLQNSSWLTNIKKQFKKNKWPNECIRCKEIEDIGETSVRQHSINAHKKYVLENNEYIFVTGLIDNVCNAACITCSAKSSTLIGKLSNNLFLVNNRKLFNTIPIDQILVFEITGGEPSVSKSYKEILSLLTEKTKYVRVNTNGKKFIPEIERLLQAGIDVTVTLSIDGVGSVFDYMRWPIKWKEFNTTVNKYKELEQKYSNLKLDFWVTVSALNVNDIDNIKKYADTVNIPMSYALLHEPLCLSIRYKNRFTFKISDDHVLRDQSGTLENNETELNAYIEKNDRIKNISINDFIKL